MDEQELKRRIEGLDETKIEYDKDGRPVVWCALCGSCYPGVHQESCPMNQPFVPTETYLKSANRG